MAEAEGQEFKAIFSYIVRSRPTPSNRNTISKKFFCVCIFFYLYDKGREGTMGWLHSTAQIPPSNLWEKKAWYSHYVEILIWETPRTYWNMSL